MLICHHTRLYMTTKCQSQLQALYIFRNPNEIDILLKVSIRLSTCNLLLMSHGFIEEKINKDFFKIYLWTYAKPHNTTLVLYLFFLFSVYIHPPQVLYIHIILLLLCYHDNIFPLISFLCVIFKNHITGPPLDIMAPTVS